MATRSGPDKYEVELSMTALPLYRDFKLMREKWGLQTDGHQMFASICLALEIDRDAESDEATQTIADRITSATDSVRETGEFLAADVDTIPIILGLVKTADKLKSVQRSNECALERGYSENKFRTEIAPPILAAIATSLDETTRPTILGPLLTDPSVDSFLRIGDHSIGTSVETHVRAIVESDSQSHLDVVVALLSNDKPCDRTALERVLQTGAGPTLLRLDHWETDQSRTYHQPEVTFSSPTMDCTSATEIIDNTSRHPRIVTYRLHLPNREHNFIECRASYTIHRSQRSIWTGVPGLRVTGEIELTCMIWPFGHLTVDSGIPADSVSYGATDLDCRGVGVGVYHEASNAISNAGMTVHYLETM